MKITMHIMDDIMNRLYLRETIMIRWPNVRPTSELLSVDITCTEGFGIEDVGADCVCITVAVDCCSPNKPGIGKDTFARMLVDPDVGKDSLVMT